MDGGVKLLEEVSTLLSDIKLELNVRAFSLIAVLDVKLPLVCIDAAGRLRHRSFVLVERGIPVIEFNVRGARSQRCKGKKHCTERRVVVSDTALRRFVPQ